MARLGIGDKVKVSASEHLTAFIQKSRWDRKGPLIVYDRFSVGLEPANLCGCHGKGELNNWKWAKVHTKKADHKPNCAFHLPTDAEQFCSISFEGLPGAYPAHWFKDIQKKAKAAA